MSGLDAVPFRYPVRNVIRNIGSGTAQKIQQNESKEPESTFPADLTVHQQLDRTYTTNKLNFYQHDNPQSGADIFGAKVVYTRIEKAYAHSLWGKPIEVESAHGGLEEEKVMLHKVSSGS